jgi:hypothetical protein
MSRVIRVGIQRLSTVIVVPLTVAGPSGKVTGEEGIT